MSITLLIILVNVACSLYVMNGNYTKYKYTLNGPAIDNKNEYYRFLTSGFIHADYTHLAFNMLSLYFFGDAVQAYYEYYNPEYGQFLYVAMYLSGVVVANLPSYIKHKRNFHYHSLGASGAVAAAIFTTILFNPAQKIYLYFAVGIPGVVFGGLYLWYSAYAASRSNDNINHDAHFYGALWGIVFTLVLFPESLNSFLRNITKIF